MRIQSITLGTTMLWLLLFFASGQKPCSAQVAGEAESKEARDSGLPVYRWSDRSVKPKAVVVIVHGFTQHAKSAESLATRLAHDGFIVLSLDQRGHGLWHFGRKRDSSGYACDYKKTADDLVQLLNVVKTIHPNLPLFCIGESAGSGIVSRAASAVPGFVNGIILCSPGTQPRVINPAWVVPDFLLNVFRLDHPVDLERYITRYSTNDPRISVEMIQDPLTRCQLTGKEILGTGYFICKTRDVVRKLDPSVSLLVVQGEQDHLLEPLSSKKIYDANHSISKKLVMLKSCGHVLLGTRYIKPEVLETIEGWLNDQTVIARMSIGATVAVHR